MKLLVEMSISVNKHHRDLITLLRLQTITESYQVNHFKDRCHVPID